MSGGKRDGAMRGKMKNKRAGAQPLVEIGGKFRAVARRKTEKNPLVECGPAGLEISRLKRSAATLNLRAKRCRPEEENEQPPEESSRARKMPGREGRKGRRRVGKGGNCRLAGGGQEKGGGGGRGGKAKERWRSRRRGNYTGRGSRDNRSVKRGNN
ncbi:hypothetical protein KM043_001976 [Ampulex compressa]|nr:hypothetical protein KM043_001976 [Ampulex compressa]